MSLSGFIVPSISSNIPTIIASFAELLGSCSAMGPSGRIVNVLSLSSEVDEFKTSDILTLHCSDGVFGIVHSYSPELAGVLEIISNQVLPLSVVYSSLTLSISYLYHFIFCVVPTFHISPPIGLSSVTKLGTAVNKKFVISPSKSYLVLGDVPSTNCDKA